MKKIGIILMCLCLWTCDTEDKKVKKIEEVPVSGLVFQDDIIKLKYVEYGLDAKAKTDILIWEKFVELEIVMSQLKTGDLSYFQDESKDIVLLMKDLINSIPDVVNTPSIQARLVSLETKMLKLQGTLILKNIPKEEHLENVKEVLVAYSNLNLQINKKYEKDSQKIEKP
ncbi:hypothetical protein [Formosa sp. L2A11]|uniref:hypothetical protein n=1 Tax=Formosa sp. L2A11 TaxID=2686363 RepID=UPI00131B2595|nr:hypothetical protein [Formosa sp. L2A11]